MNKSLRQVQSFLLAHSIGTDLRVSAHVPELLLPDTVTEWKMMSLES